METIFTYNPSANELLELTGDAKTSESKYLLDRSGDFLVLDLALLFQLRNETDKSKEYWDKIPEMKLQFEMGFDDLLVVAE